MGDFRVRTITSQSDRHAMYKHAMDDIDTFEKMMADGAFTDGPIHIGAEQEMCLVDSSYQPMSKSLDVLGLISDGHYTNELALYNLEVNLDPHEFTKSCFSDTEKELLSFLDLGRERSDQIGGKIFLTGILPSLQYSHLQFDHMTPIQRYKTLSESLYQLRGKEFEVHLQGVDEILLSLKSVLFEACNTSFQLHLQIHPDDFVSMHNWSQMIAGPVLSMAVNSPLLFGEELWSETRIALFKQSLDTRTTSKFMRRKVPRVYFGSQWLEKSAAELWKNDLIRFPLVVTSDDLSSSSEDYSNGEIPKLRAIRLHNGTTYTWNRLCYGHDDTSPHLRIECRYLPAGPTPIDEIANFVFWAGLMNAAPDKEVRFWDNVRFKEVRGNFVKAARTGLNTIFHWYGQPISAQELILETLLPMSKVGLIKAGIDEAEIKRYLSVIEKRVSMHRTGASWTVNQYRRLQDTHSSSTAIEILMADMWEKQLANEPMHQWESDTVVTPQRTPDEMLVEDMMTSEVHSLNPEVSVGFAKKVLEWNNIHHLPIENHEGDLVGLLTDGVIDRFFADGGQGDTEVGVAMIKEPISIQRKSSIGELRALMKKEVLSGVPVIHETKLVGIITNRDLEKVK